MIGAAVVREVRDLLAEGKLSQRKIAQQVGVSRGTVNAIARGKRPEYAAAPLEPGVDFRPPSGPPARCPGCGGMVRMPCLVCHVRALKELRRLPSWSVRQRLSAGK
jgi:hypothetical protein